MFHRNGPVEYKVWGVMQQGLYGTNICDIYGLQKCFMQTWVNSEQNVIEATIDQWRDSLRSYMHTGGGHCEHMLQNYVYLHDLVQQNILSNYQCNLVHFMTIL